MDTEIRCPRCELRFVEAAAPEDPGPIDHAHPLPSIVVPVDPSQPPSAAVPLAVMLARQSGAPLQFVAVQAGPGERISSQAYVSRRVRHARHAGVEAVGHKHLEDIDPAAAIVEHLTHTPCSFLCLASHGRSAIGEDLLGSVSERLLRRAAVPVLLVGPEVADTGSAVHSLVGCIEGPELGPAVAEVARQMASLLSADLSLIQVVHGPVPADVLDSGFLHRLAASIAPPVVEHETRRGTHGPAAAILGYAGSRSGTILAVGTHARTGLRRMVMGSVALELVRRGPWPVLIVPPALSANLRPLRFEAPAVP